MSSISQQCNRRVLVVDDERDILDAVSDSLAGEFDVVTESNAARALELVSSDPDFAVIVSDQRMPRMQGFEFLNRVQDLCSATRLLMTGYSDIESVVQGVNQGRIYSYIAKPWNREKLAAIVRDAARHFELQIETVRDRELFRALMENIPDAIELRDADQRFLRVNRSAARLLGFDDSRAAEGQTPAAIRDARHRRLATLEDRIVTNGTSPVADRLASLAAENGRHLWLSVSKGPTRNANGDLDGQVSTTRDITPRHQTTLALQLREAALHRAARLTRIGCRILDVEDNRISFESATFETFAGKRWTENAVNVSGWLRSVHPSDQDVVTKAYTSVATADAPVTLHYRLRHEDGTFFFVKELLEPFRRSDNKPLWFSTVQDTTSLERENRHLRMLTVVNQVAAEANDFNEAVRLTLHRICYEIGWDYAEAWFPDEQDPDRLAMHVASIATRPEGQRFHTASSEYYFRSGETIVGKVWQSARPRWVPNVRELSPEEFARNDSAWEQSLFSMAFLPIPSPRNRRTLGVVGLAAHAKLELDDRTMRIIGDALEAFGACVDKLQTRTRLMDYESRLECIAANVPGAIYRWTFYASGENCRQFLNPNAHALFGEGADALCDVERLLANIHPDDQETVRTALSSCILKKAPWELLYRLKSPHSGETWIQDRASPQTLANGELVYSGVALDVTEQIDAEQRASFLSNHDAPTGLPNRNTLARQLSAWLKSRGNTATPALVWVHIDQLQSYLDTRGPGQADALIMKIAGEIRSLLSDRKILAINANRDLLLATADLDGQLPLRRLATIIHKAVGRTSACDEEDILLSASIGIAYAPAHAKTSGDLLQAASIASENARTAGGDTTRFYTMNMGDTARNKISMQSQLRLALAADALDIYYEPILDADTLRVKGAEALLRWPQPDGSFVRPVDFIPVAEADPALIEEIGQWSLDVAARQARSLSDDGIFPGRLCVNISTRHLDRPGFIRQVQSALRNNHCAAEWLQLEITETALMANVERALGRIQELREIGLNVAIDDFGTGYSSLSYLRELPCNNLKIDRSFVQKLVSDRKTAALVNSIVQLAHALGMQVTAEGLEGAPQLMFLRALDCDLVQGHAFHKAMPAAEFIDVLRNEGSAPANADSGCWPLPITDQAGEGQ